MTYEQKSYYAKKIISSYCAEIEQII